MPRRICQRCKKRKIEYRVYFDDNRPAPSKFSQKQRKAEVCRNCALKFFKRDLVFNLRRIYAEHLGNAHLSRSNKAYEAWKDECYANS